MSSGLTPELFDKIQNMVPVKDRLFEIEGRTHTLGKFTPVPPPQQQCLQFATLDGFIDYANEFGSKEKNMITIDSHLNVSLRSKNRDKNWNTFEIFAVANASEYTANFDFGQKYEAEDFMIRLQTAFVQDETRDLLIKVASNLTAGTEASTDDDGITQKTTVGRAVKTKVKIENPVVLKPFRTFQEIEQIASPFVFRIHSDYAEPRLALYESDSGKWKMDAISGIKAYLESNVEEIKSYA